VGFFKKLFGSNKSDSQAAKETQKATSSSGKIDLLKDPFANVKVFILTCCTSEIAMSTMRELAEEEIISKMKEDSLGFLTLYMTIDQPSVQVFRKSAIVANTKSAVVSTAREWLRSELGSDAPSDINAIYGKSFYEREGYIQPTPSSGLGDTSIGFSVMFYFHGFSR
jgi:hypothetical protein